MHAGTLLLCFVPVKKKFTVSKIPRSDGDLRLCTILLYILVAFCFGFFIRGTKTGTFVYRVCVGGKKPPVVIMGQKGSRSKLKSTSSAQFQAAASKFTPDELRDMQIQFRTLAERSKGPTVDKSTFLKYFPIP